MSDLLAIDPGVHECAVALFRHGQLWLVRMHHVPLPWDQRKAERVVCETPQDDSRVGVHNIALARNGAYLAGNAHVPDSHSPALPTFVTPSEWKGSTPKPIHHDRVWNAMTEAERALFPADTRGRIFRALERGAKDAWRKDGAYYYGKGKGHEVHNLLDAAGLGLWHLGRLAK